MERIDLDVRRGSPGRSPVSVQTLERAFGDSRIRRRFRGTVDSKSVQLSKHPTVCSFLLVFQPLLPLKMR